MQDNVRKRAKEVGVQIQRLRKRKNYSRNELSKRAGISSKTLRAIENGESNFLISTLAKIAWALEVNVVDLWPD